MPYPGALIPLPSTRADQLSRDASALLAGDTAPVPLRGHATPDATAHRVLTRDPVEKPKPSDRTGSGRSGLLLWICSRLERQPAAEFSGGA
jgi:hypothetical protein